MSSVSTSRSTRVTSTVLTLLLALSLSFLASSCGEKQSKSDAPLTEAQINTLLLSLVPAPKHVASRCQQWVAEQAKVIEFQKLDPRMVVDAIKWYTANVSEAGQIEGYTIYPLVERWQTRMKLDSLVPLRITELNRQPLWAQPTFYSPSKKSGVAFGADLMKNLTDAINLAGGEIGTPEDFQELCIGFDEMAFRDPQIFVHDTLDWALYEFADSLANRSPGPPEANKLAQALLDTVSTMESVWNLHELPQAVAFHEYIDEHLPDWQKRLQDLKFMWPLPTKRKGSYRWQVSIVDGYSMQVRITVFNYNPVDGFHLKDIEQLPPVRSHIQLG